ncbi:MAG: Fic family protein [Bacilli bacterium]
MEKDPYLIENTNILKNKLNITDKDELLRQEKIIVLKKLVQLFLSPIKGEFDTNHLLYIHKFLFDEIYPFAGLFRETELSKNGDNFLELDFIKKSLEESLADLNSRIKEVSSAGEYAFLLGDIYNSLIVIHPFREGNGRSIREFLREFVYAKNNDICFGQFELDFTKMDKDNMLLGIKERYLYPSMIEMEFMKGLVTLKQNINTK